MGGGASEMDELGLGPPPQTEGASMKNVVTGAPPPGFAEYMKRKAEKALEMKHKMEEEKAAKLAAMKAARAA
jgi:hypothetical protein|tara:strand:- start:406 stop:621 length:216 start_codon:yes stop_codon:yes gene_type:complete